MQRYHAGSCTSAVNNSAISGIQARDPSRADPSTLPSNFSLNSRRSAQPTPYKLRCDKEQLNSRCDEMATSAEEDSKKKLQPQLVKLDKAFKLAEQWVNNMSTSSVNEKSPSVELEGRPSRLGIGATVPKESKFTQSSNPVERKLLAKLHNDRRKISMKHEDLAPSAKNGNADEDSEEEESESKARAFTKKRPLGPISLLHAKKKHR